MKKSTIYSGGAHHKGKMAVLVTQLALSLACVQLGPATGVDTQESCPLPRERNGRHIAVTSELCRVSVGLTPVSGLKRARCI